MITLGIESTCDETGCSIVRNGKEILSNVISSQIDLHKEYGGVVPELACRRHIDVIIPVLDESLKQANISLEEVDLIAVAHGPGLIGALLIGLNAAKALAFTLNKPLIGVNHIKAHLYAAIMSQLKPVNFPCLGVVLSGGHTAIVLMHDLSRYQLIGQTVDDAIGEAFDKTAKILGLPYPGGPQIEKLAQLGNPQAFSFKGGHVKASPLDFSFSGLKTAVLYAVKGQNGKADATEALSNETKADLAASFQQAALTDVLTKVSIAAKQYGVRHVIFGGGVTNNKRLRWLFEQAAPEMTCLWPKAGLDLDNAAMIAGLGHMQFIQQGRQGDSLELQPLTRIHF
jgi:N6-L-threonylcarbamoyladenine synthase